MDKEYLEMQLALAREHIAYLSKKAVFYETRYKWLSKVKEECYKQVIVRLEDAAGNIKQFNNVIVESFFDMNTLKDTMIIKLKEAENEQNKTK